MRGHNGHSGYSEHGSHGEHRPSTSSNNGTHNATGRGSDAADPADPDSRASTPPRYVCLGGTIIDDIVQPDGTTHMGVLGGGVTHMAAGIRVWDERPGLITCLGTDLPAPVQQRLARDFDLRGAVRLDLPQLRAWQIFEWDGKRTEVFRVAHVRPFIYGPDPRAIPAVYRRAPGVGLLCEADVVPTWRAQFPAATVLWEPPQQFMIAANRDAFRAALAQVDIVSPNLLEAAQLYEQDDPAALVRTMLADGAPVAALRMGAEGSLVGHSAGTELVHVPPVPVPQIVDQTGAGNTYCGGFLVGWLRSGDPAQAGAYGAVSASFSLEVTGVADPPAPGSALRDQRYQWIMQQLARQPR